MEEVALGQVFLVVLIILEQYFSVFSSDPKEFATTFLGNRGCISVMCSLKVIHLLIKGIKLFEKHRGISLIKYVYFVGSLEYAIVKPTVPTKQETINFIKVKSRNVLLRLLQLCIRSCLISALRYIVLIVDTSHSDADPSSREVQCAVLRPLACCDCEFESRRRHGCLSLAIVVCGQIEVSASG